MKNLSNEVINLQNSLMMFAFNYPNDFIERCWKDSYLKDHMIAKFHAFYKSKGSLGIMYFYTDLDQGNKVKFLNWVANNYSCKIYDKEPFNPENPVLLYTTDSHHSKSSMHLEGVCQNKIKAIEAAIKNYGLNQEEINQLENMNQTQGREINIMIELIEIYG